MYTPKKLQGEILLSFLRENDDRTWSNFYNSCKGKAFGMLWQVADEDDRKEIFQEACIIFCRKLNEERGVKIKNAEYYFYGIIRLLRFEYFKKQKKLQESQVTFADEEELGRMQLFLSESRGFESEQLHIMAEVQQLIAKESEENQHLILLKYVHGLDAKEIIEDFYPQLDVTRLSTRLYDIKRRIKKRLSNPRK